MRPIAAPTPAFDVPECSAPARRWHLTALGLSLAVLGLAAFLRNSPDGRVRLPGRDAPLPGVCYSQSLFGVACPGCGLTRSFIALAHGNARLAWRFNPAGWLLFAIALCQPPYRLWCLVRRRPALAAPWLTYAIGGFVALALLLQWVSRLVFA